MKQIPNFQEFEEINPLYQKITPQLAESLAGYFSEDGTINESGFFDSIKNNLSKTFLGSLSYLNIIDKVRAEVLKLEKELVTKRYAFQDEIESLRKDIKDLSSSGNEFTLPKTQKTMELKKKEHETYENVTNTRIQKALEAVRSAIKENKRRKEYYDAGKAQDELELAEFEYQIAKKRAASGSEDLRKLEAEIKKAKEEALKAQEEVKKGQKKESESRKRAEEEGIKTLDVATPDFQKSLRTERGTRSLILYLKAERDKLEDKMNDVKNDNARQALKNSINKVRSDLKLAEKVLDQHKSKKLLSKHEEHQQMIMNGARELSKNDTERKSTLQKAENIIKGMKSSKTTSPAIKGKNKDVVSQEKEAKTTSKVNQTIK
jgi:hypothetical protein